MRVVLSSFFVLVFTASVALAEPNPSNDHPYLLNVQLVAQRSRQASDAGAASREVKPDPAGRWGKYDVTVTLRVPAGTGHDCSVLVNFDGIFAPLPLPEDLEKRDLRTAIPYRKTVSLMRHSHMVFARRDRPSYTTTLATVSIDDVVEESAKESPKSPWPYIVRATVQVFDLTGTVLDESRVELELRPTQGPPIGGSSPNPVNPSGRTVTGLANCARPAPPRPGGYGERYAYTD